MQDETLSHRSSFWADRLGLDQLFEPIQEHGSFAAFSSRVRFTVDLSTILDRMFPPDVPLPLNAEDLDTQRYRSCEAVQRANDMDQEVVNARDDRAIDILASDLAMSLKVYSYNTLTSASRQDEVDANGIPPKIAYGYLLPADVEDVDEPSIQRPARRSSSNYQRKPVPANPQLLGPRSLLTEWVVGTDPQDYIYVNPYPDDQGDDRPETEPPIDRDHGPPTVSSTQNLGFSQRAPPTIPAVPVGRIPTLAPMQGPAPEIVSRIPAIKPLVASESQPLLQLELPTTQSQDFVGPSTQPVSGPFGARQSFAPKKAKKRVGGF